MSYLEYLTETSSVIELMKDQGLEVENALAHLVSTVERQGTIFFCGNGGSAADSQHWAAELVGDFRSPGKPIRALSLTTDTSIISSIANDVSWDEVYSRQLDAMGDEGDVLIAISTSGNSSNLIEAVKMARAKKITSLLISGGTGGKLLEISDIAIVVPSCKTEIIQHMHITIGHYLTGCLAERFR